MAKNPKQKNSDPNPTAGTGDQTPPLDPQWLEPAMSDEDRTAAEEVGYEGPDRRATVVDRRYLPGGFERRRGAGIRRPEFNKTAEEGEMSPEQFMFIQAINAYKSANDSPYPTWTEVLEVIRRIGYRKTMASEVQMSNAEDWTEAADSPAWDQYDVDDWKPEAA